MSTFHSSFHTCPTPSHVFHTAAFLAHFISYILCFIRPVIIQQYFTTIQICNSHSHHSYFPLTWPMTPSPRGGDSFFIAVMLSLILHLHRCASHSTCYLSLPCVFHPPIVFTLTFWSIFIPPPTNILPFLTLWHVVPLSPRGLSSISFFPFKHCHLSTFPRRVAITNIHRNLKNTLTSAFPHTRMCEHTHLLCV